MNWRLGLPEILTLCMSGRVLKSFSDPNVIQRLSVIGNKHRIYLLNMWFNDLVVYACKYACERACAHTHKNN